MVHNWQSIVAQKRAVVDEMGFILYYHSLFHLGYTGQARAQATYQTLQVIFITPKTVYNAETS